MAEEGIDGDDVQKRSAKHEAKQKSPMDESDTEEDEDEITDSTVSPERHMKSKTPGDCENDARDDGGHDGGNTDAKPPTKRKRGRRPMPVERICLETSKVLERFPSVQTAANAMDITHCSISKCLNQRARAAGGYFWRYESSNALPLPSSHYLALKQDLARRRAVPGQLFNRKSVHQVCLSTDRVLKTFDSIRSAATEINVTGANIGNVIHGRAKSAGGYGWRLANVPPTKTGKTEDAKNAVNDATVAKKTHPSSDGVIRRIEQHEEAAAAEHGGPGNSNDANEANNAPVPVEPVARRPRLESDAPTLSSRNENNSLAIPNIPMSASFLPAFRGIQQQQAIMPPTALPLTFQGRGISISSATTVNPSRASSLMARAQLQQPPFGVPSSMQIQPGLLPSAQLSFTNQLFQSERIRALESQVQQQHLLISTMTQMGQSGQQVNQQSQQQLQIRQLEQQIQLQQLQQLGRQERIFQVIPSSHPMPNTVFSGPSPAVAQLLHFSQARQFPSSPNDQYHPPSNGGHPFPPPSGR